MNHLVQPWANPSQAMNLLKVGLVICGAKGAPLSISKTTSLALLICRESCCEVWNWFHESCNGASAHTFSVAAARCLEHGWVNETAQSEPDALCVTGIVFDDGETKSILNINTDSILPNDLDTNAGLGTSVHGMMHLLKYRSYR